MTPEERNRIRAQAKQFVADNPPPPIPPAEQERLRRLIAPAVAGAAHKAS